MMPIKYPKSFVSEVVSEYGKDSSVSTLAVSGSFALGNFLADGISRQMAPEDIISLLESKKEKEMLENAKSCLNRRRLHKEWLRIMTEEIKTMDEEAFNSRPPTKVLPLFSESTISHQ